MCSQLLDPSWPECDNYDLFPYEGYPHTMNIEFLELGESDFSFSLTNTEDSHTKSSLAPSSPSLDYISCMYFDGNLQSFNGAFMDDDQDQVMKITEGIISDNHKESIDDIFRWMDEISGDSPLRSPSLSISSSTSMGGEQEVHFEQHSLVLPAEKIEIDNQLSIIHLLKACGEAKEKECVELEEVIQRRVREKSMPVGEILERLGFYCCSNETQTDYLKEESNKNYEVAFRAFYEMCPYGRFAHFTANRAILEAIPNDAEKVHILDFDIGDGVQWPPLLQSLNGREVRITAVKWKEEERRSCSFHETSRRLCEYSKSSGLRLRVEEIEMEGLSMLFAEKKRKRKRGSESIREWMAANCMVGFPHMASTRSRRQVLNFLVTVAAADDSIGILTFGSGGVVVGESSNPGSSSNSFGSYFEGCLVHFHALLESMEWHLPSSNLSLARTAMECLFVAPNVSLHACFLQWKEGTREGFGGQGHDFELLANGFKSRPLSIGNLEEARHLVYSGLEGGMYGVKAMSPNGNEMVLEWSGTPLVRISAWTR